MNIIYKVLLKINIIFAKILTEFFLFFFCFTLSSDQSYLKLSTQRLMALLRGPGSSGDWSVESHLKLLELTEQESLVILVNFMQK